MTGIQEAQEQVNRIFEMFAHHRRRHALRALQSNQGRMAVAALADEVAIRENEAPIDKIPAEEVDRVHRSLHHVHLPKLADATLIRYDPDRDTVTLSAQVDDVDQYQELLTID